MQLTKAPSTNQRLVLSMCLCDSLPQIVARLFIASEERRRIRIDRGFNTPGLYDMQEKVQCEYEHQIGASTVLVFVLKYCVFSIHAHKAYILFGDSFGRANDKRITSLLYDRLSQVNPYRHIAWLCLAFATTTNFHYVSYAMLHLITTKYTHISNTQNSFDFIPCFIFLAEVFDTTTTKNLNSAVLTKKLVQCKRIFHYMKEVKNAAFRDIFGKVYVCSTVRKYIFCGLCM